MFCDAGFFLSVLFYLFLSTSTEKTTGYKNDASEPGGVAYFVSSRSSLEGRAEEEGKMGIFISFLPAEGWLGRYGMHAHAATHARANIITCHGAEDAAGR